MLEVEVLPDPEAVARRGAEIVCETVAEAIAARGRCTLAVSGGHTPWAMFAELPQTLPWDRIAVYQVDERVAPDGDPDRNLTHLLESLPPGADADVHPMPVGEDDLEAAAAGYAAALPDTFDLVHLGLGADGHTASLVPGDPVLDLSDRDVAATREYEGRRRMTLTYPTLDRARRILWLVTGADKAGAFRLLRAGDRSIPAGRVARERAVVVADAAAAGGGSQSS